MQSENFDKKIRDSLSQRPEGNDNPEWEKMERLLNKHLPVEKKDRRRFFIFLFTFAFLLLGGGALIIWQLNSGNKNEIADRASQKQKEAATKNNKNNLPNTSPENNSIRNEPSSNLPVNKNDQSASTEQFIPIQSKNNDQPLAGKEIVVKLPDEKDGMKKNNKTAITKKNEVWKETNVTVKDPDKNEKSKITDENVKTETNPVTTEKDAPVKNNETLKAETENKITDQKQETKETQALPEQQPPVQKQKNKSSFLNNLLFSVSAGPDYSTVGMDNNGKIKLAYGAGIGYQVFEKFTIRTGFYTARKVYTADPDEYHPPYNLSAYYPNLKYIDADCKVYEIPLNIDYTISKNNKQSWFVSAGVSSLLMKKETYEYHYKPNNSPTYITYTKTINDQNKHYFSILNLSGGYTRTINKNISLRAEPYMKIALRGVGYGKVNLNSGGVLFSAIIKPFGKK